MSKMKHAVIIFLSLLLLASCHPRIQETDTISERGVDSAYAAYLVLARRLPDSDRSIGPYIYLEKDTESAGYLIDSPRLVIGHFIDSTHVFAMSCRNLTNDSSLLKIYRLQDEKWKLIGGYQMPYAVMVQIKNSDGDTRSDEIILESTPNMNGNKQVLFFKYDPVNDILKYSGEIFGSEGDPKSDDGGYMISPKDNTVKSFYQGSWYMDQIKSLYVWHADSLILLRSASMHIIDQVKAQKGISNNQLEYRENKDTCFSCGLTEVFSEKDSENSHNHKKYWDHFFDLK